jgi:hypothetical protein
MSQQQWWETVGQWEHEIETHFDPKPIPTARFDWCATFQGYEPGCPVGWGATEAEAINNLKEQAQ